MREIFILYRMYVTSDVGEFQGWLRHELAGADDNQVAGRLGLMDDCLFLCCLEAQGHSSFARDDEMRGEDLVVML